MTCLFSLDLHVPTVRRALLAALLGAAASNCVAQTEPPGMLQAVPQNVVSLSATASVDVAKDWLTVIFSTQREGIDAATVQSQLKQALEAALVEARKLARPGQVEVQTGGFSLHPRYAPKGAAAGWQGSTELIVEGRDTQAIAQLTARIKTLSIGRVAFSLSREVRLNVEADVAAQAIAGFRNRAEAVSKQFGFGTYTLREVQVTSQSNSSLELSTMNIRASRAMNDEALPVEAGKQTVTAIVSGSVQMK